MDHEMQAILSKEAERRGIGDIGARKNGGEPSTLPVTFPWKTWPFHGKTGIYWQSCQKAKLGPKSWEEFFKYPPIFSWAQVSK
jgi:hypothetical protein